MTHWSDVAGDWVLAPLPVLCATAAIAVYAVGVRSVRRSRSTGWRRRRTTAFVAGVLLGLFAVVGPPGALDDTFFTAHMVQHLVMMMLAAPLVVVGSPVLLVLQTSPPGFRRRWLVPVLRSRVATWLTHPAVGWVLFAGTVVATHFSPFYNYAIEHPLVHDYVEHPLYFMVALVFYYPLIGSNPVPHGPTPLGRMLSLLLMGGPMSMTGFFIYTARSVMYPAYLVADRSFGPDPLGDQQTGGALMWSLGMLVQIIWVALVVPVWLRAEERKGRRLDRALVAGHSTAVSP